MPVTAADHQKYMDIAKEQARKSLAEGGCPIGACLVHLPTGEVLGKGHNEMKQNDSLILHAEMVALQNAGRAKDVTAATLRECAMFTTLSACPMCSGAIVLYKLKMVST